MRFVAIVDKETVSDKKVMTIRLGILDIINEEGDVHDGHGILVTQDIFQQEHVKACEELTKKFKMTRMNCQSIERITTSDYNEDGVYSGQRSRLVGMHGCSRSGRTFIDNLHKAVGKMKGENKLYIYIVGSAAATPFEGEWEYLPAYVQDFFEK